MAQRSRSRSLPACPRLILGAAALALIAAPAAAIEKASEQVAPFYGSFSHAIPIDVPSYRGLEPRLALTYSSEGRNGFVGVGWNLWGQPDRARKRGPRDATLRGGRHLPAGWPGARRLSAGQPQPELHDRSVNATSTKNESYLRIRFDSTGNTWTVWGRDGTRTVFTPIFTVPPSGYVAGGTLIWGQTSAIDTHNNMVTYAWSCVGGDCYPNSISYNGYQITFYREGRPDPQSFAAATVVGQMLYRLRSVIVQLGGDPIRGYQLSYSTSPSPDARCLDPYASMGRISPTTRARSRHPEHLYPRKPSPTRTMRSARASWTGGSPGGTATEPVTWVAPVNASVTGAGYDLTKTAGVDGDWDAGATSTRAITSGNGYLQFTSTQPNTQRVVGLSNGSGTATRTKSTSGLPQDRDRCT